MIVKHLVNHKVGTLSFCKHWAKRAYNAFPSRFAPPLDRQTLFIFVVGCGHSGTTLLAAKLSNHTKIMGIGRETAVLTPGNHSLFAIRAMADQWSYFCESSGRSCVLEKTPKHIYSYDLVQKIIPNNKFIVMIRNPLDTIASLYKRFGDLDLCIERWLLDSQEALNYRGKNNAILVKYEDFTKMPERKMVEITEFLGLEYQPSMLISNESIYSKIKQEDNMKIREEQVNKPIRPNLGTWRKVFDEKQASKIMERVGKVAIELGYKE